MSWLQALRDRYRVKDDPLRTERRIEAFVILLFLLLLLQLVYGASRLTILSASEPILPAPDALEVVNSSPRDRVTPEQSREIRKRPLFWPERRPFKAVVEEPEPEELAEQELKDIKLVGIFGAGDSVGIIAAVNGKPQRIHLGQVVEGWKLEKVENNEAVFTAGNRRKKATLQQDSGNVEGRAGKRRERRR